MTRYCPTCATEWTDDRLMCPKDGDYTESAPVDEVSHVQEPGNTAPEWVVEVGMVGIVQRLVAGPGMLIGREGEYSLFASALESAGYTNVGRQHCHLRIDDDGSVVVVDLSSTNGTFVNGVRLAPNEP